MERVTLSRKIAAPVFLSLFYLFISKVCFYFLLTIVTSLVLFDGDDQASKTIHEISNQYIFLSYSLGAIITLLICWANDHVLDGYLPLSSQSSKKPWSFRLSRPARLNFWRGVGSGMIISFSVIFLLYFSGQSLFLGSFISPFTHAPIFFLFLANSVSLGFMVLCEEYIFRHKVLGLLKERIAPFYAIFVSSLIYVLIKHFQFQLACIDYLSLFIVNFSAGFFYLRTKNIFRGVGFLGTLYGFTHFVFGLTLWGHAGAGLFLIKDSSFAFPIITGGKDGPLAGLAMVGALLLLTISSYWGWRQSRVRVQ